jgi:uncharacterized protein (TIGR00251 family)
VVNGPIEPTASGIRVRVRVLPRASKSELAGIRGDALCVRLTAPPVDGAANQALVRFLAERLGVRPAALRILTGLTGRRKLVEVDGLAPGEARARLGLS